MVRPSGKVFNGYNIEVKDEQPIFGQDYTNASVPNEMDIPVSYNAGSLAFSAPGNTNKLTMSFKAATGIISGSFANSAGSKSSLPFQGIVVGGTNYGFFVDTNKETGPVILVADPDGNTEQTVWYGLQETLIFATQNQAASLELPSAPESPPSPQRGTNGPPGPPPPP